MKNITASSIALEDSNLDRVFHALADGTRRNIIARLSQGNGTVSALAEPFDMSLNAVSKHLKVLEGAQLIDREIIGRTSVCSLKADVLQDAMSWIDQYSAFWGGTLDSLEEHMDKQLSGPPIDTGGGKS
ncbi:MAG: ArsR/SmtB family transcription factor [Hyphomicrobiales bacterium]